MNTTINQQIILNLKNLALLRKKKDQFKVAFDNALKEFQDLNASLIEGKARNADEIDLVENQLREYALGEYKITGSKECTGGMGIRVMKKLEYDPVEAYKWAIHHEMALSLNRKEFEKIALMSGMESYKPQFVEIKDEPKATIPQEINLEGLEE